MDLSHGETDSYKMSCIQYFIFTERKIMKIKYYKIDFKKNKIRFPMTILFLIYESKFSKQD